MDHMALDEEEPESPKRHSEANVQPDYKHVVESIDGFDDYGNPLPTADSSNARKRKQETLPPPPEPWANRPESLPMQSCSFVGWAALQVDQREVALPLPQGLGAVDAPVVERALAQLGMAPKEPKTPLQIARAPQTRLYQDGYQAAHTLTVLERSEVSALLRAENQELANAAHGVQSPDDMLPPRSMAITILCNGASNTQMTPNQKLLLDAAAHLAAEPGSDGERSNVRAAEQLRMTFLHGEMALAYARDHIVPEKRGATKSQCLREPCNEVCVTWPEAIGMGASGYTVRSEFMVIKHCDTAEEYVAALLEAVLTVWRDSNVVPDPLRLLGSYAHGAAPADAYARHSLACARAFWSKLETHHPAELSEFATNDPKYCGALAHSNLWAKVVQRNTPIDDPNTSHGILLHQEGWRDEAREYLQRVKAEEAERKVKGAWGLRAPMDNTECSTCPHLLVVNAETTHINAEICCFGLRGVAGERLGPKPPRLVWRLLPVTTTLTDAVYVLPCHWEATMNAQEVTIDAMGNTNARAVYAYRAAMGHTVPNLDTNPKVARARTEDEANLATLLGMPLSCPAFCIGDVTNALQGVSPRVARIPTGLGAFLVAAAAALTPEASINDAFGWASESTERVNALSMANQALAARVEELEHRLQKDAATAAEEAATAATPASPPSAPTSPPPAAPPSAPAPPPPPLEPVRFTNAQRAALLRRWGRDGDMSGAMFRALNNPIVGVSLKTILVTVADAVKSVDANAQQQAYEWAKTTCCKKRFGDRERIVRLCHHALRNAGPMRVFLLWTDETGNTTVYEIDLAQAPEAELAEPVKAKARLKLDAKELKSVVVFAWIGTQRALAALLPA